MGGEQIEIFVDDITDEFLYIEVLHNSASPNNRINKLRLTIGHLAEKLENSKKEILNFNHEIDAGARLSFLLWFLCKFVKELSN